MIDRIFHSQNYIGGKRKNYFEGWYFKCQYNDKIYSFIVGISNSIKEKHSFIQYIDNKNSHYFSYPITDFSYDKTDMTIKISGNIFSLKGIECNIIANNITINADLRFDNHNLFKKTLFCPSVMGIFGYIPLSCNHCVVSTSFNVNGKITYNSVELSINGLGYIEKDFGKAFPLNYYWTQGQNESISIMFALAYPLLLGIKGFLCIVNYKDKQYNLSLYKGTKLTIKQINDEHSQFILISNKLELHLCITGNKLNAQKLHSPINGGNMNGIIKENVCGQMNGYFCNSIDKYNFEVPCAYEFAISN